MGRLLIHPEHGLNPCQPVCFFCQQPLKKFAFLGGYVTTSVPAKFILSYHPCPACQKEYENAIVLVEVSEKKQGLNQLPIKVNDKNAFPTGCWLVLTDNRMALETVFDSSTVDFLLEKRTAYIWPEVYRKLNAIHEARESPSTVGDLGIAS